MERLVIDIETDGFSPSVIHMVGVLNYDTDEFVDYHGDTLLEGLLRVADADMLLAYNGIGFDFPTMRRMTEGVVNVPRQKIIEVFDMARKVTNFKMEGGYKLKRWGEVLGFPKGDHSDWTKWSPEMSVYCERDCRLTKRVFDVVRHMAMENGDPDPLLYGDGRYRILKEKR